MKMNVPIYLADVTLSLRKKEFGNVKIIKTKTLNKVFVKGFSFEDMIKRKIEQWNENVFQKKINSKEYVFVEKINLLSQHGFGVDD